MVSWSEKNKNTVNYNVLSLLLGCVGGVEGGVGGVAWTALAYVTLSFVYDCNMHYHTGGAGGGGGTEMTSD